MRKALTIIEDHIDDGEYDIDYMTEYFIMYIVNDVLEVEKGNASGRWPEIVEDTIERFILDNGGNE